MSSYLLKLPSSLSALRAAIGTLFASEITPRLYLADWLVAQNWNALDSLGITHVVSIVELAPIVPRKIDHLHVCISDLPICDISEHFDRTTAFIRGALAQEGKKVLVHCLGGLSRSVSVICAYLIAAKGLTVRESIAYAHSCRRVAHPNVGFRVQLNKYAARHGLDQATEGHAHRLPGFNLLQSGAVSKLVTDSVQHLMEGDNEVVRVARVKVLGPDWAGAVTVVTHAVVQPDASVKVDVGVV